MSKLLHIVSLGCNKNLVDTEVMLGRLRDYTLSDDRESADVIIINTCGFIDAAKQESINTILDLHEQRKEDSTLVVAGCLSERYREELALELPEVDLFTGVGDYERIDALLDSKESQFTDEVYLIDGADRVVTGSSYHAYIKISEGCNQKCSFCAIPSFKGKLNSRSLDSIAKEVESLVKQGYYDFSFISQDSSSFLRDEDIKDGLIHLIKRIELIDGVKSARILYLYPSTTTMKLIQTIGSSKIFHNYFDMPIQHITDNMLKIMKRGFGKEKTDAQLQAMKALPNSFVRTGIIVGHPGETEEDFQELCDYVKDFKFDRVSLFEYSHEEGTTAFDMDVIEEEVVQARIEKLQAIIDEIHEEKLQGTIGKTIDVIVDGESDEHEYLLSAKALLWAPDIDGEIYINDNEVEDFKLGTVYKATITDVAGSILMATLKE
jgi:ribosomal protein S12 methylthiotransferase